MMHMNAVAISIERLRNILKSKTKTRVGQVGKAPLSQGGNRRFESDTRDKNMVM